MKTHYLDLLNSQFCSYSNTVLANTYGGHKLQEFHNSLLSVCTQLNGKFIKPNISDKDKRYLSAIIQRFSRWLYLLNNNTSAQNLEPLIRSFQFILKEWLPSDEYDKHILLFSEGDYAFKIELAPLPVLNSLLRNYVGKELSHQVIDIKLPTYLRDDYLHNVSIFHEIGHFVIRHYEIQDKIMSNLSAVISDKKLMSVMVQQSFPYLDGKIYEKDRDEAKLKSHIEEYMADIFASQYVGMSLINCLEILNDGRYDKEDAEHPCFNMRKQMTESFMSKATDNILLNYILAEFHAELSCPDLDIRFDNLDESYFLTMKEYPVSTSRELTSLYKLAWDIYEDGINKYNASIGRFHTPIEVYQNLSSLVKNSIMSYVTKNP